MAARLDTLAAAEGENAGKDFHTEKGATRLGTLINKDPMFDICFLHPRGLAAVNYLMEGDFGLSSITGRAAQPGEGRAVVQPDQDPVADGVERRQRGAHQAPRRVRNLSRRQRRGTVPTA